MTKRLTKVLDYIKANYHSRIQVFFSRNTMGDEMETVWSEDGVTIEYCPYYDYLVVFGLTDEEEQQFCNMLVDFSNFEFEESEPEDVEVEELAPNKYKNFLDEIINEADNFGNGTFDIALDDNICHFDGYYPAGAQKRGRFFVYKGFVFMLDIPETMSYDDGKFWLFYFGRRFIIDQAPGAEIPAEYAMELMMTLQWAWAEE